MRHFSRGESRWRIEAGERAATPYNPIRHTALYGARLIALGEQEKGARLIKEAAALIVVPAGMNGFSVPRGLSGG